MPDRRLSSNARAASWREAWPALRDRLLSSARFQRWAARFPLTRPIARHRARSLFDLCAGFVYSQVLLACVQLRVFERLADGPRDIDDLCREMALTRDRALRLLESAASLRLVEKRGEGRYGLGMLGAVMAGNPGIRAMIEHHPMLYDDLRDPLELLRGERTETRLSRYWSYAGAEDAAGLDSRQISAYSGLMAASQPLIADEVLATYSFRRHRCLLDVGGGNGAFLSAVARRAPHLRLMLFDLPAVIGQARRRFADAPPGERVECFGGNFHVDPLPSGADLISLVRVLHDHDDDDVARLLQAIHRCLPDGGRLLLAEPMAGADSGGQATGAYFGFYLLAMGRGRPRTPAEIGELLQRAGFRRHRLLANRMPLQTRIMIADR